MELYGLIGYPLGHSFSKKYFTEKFNTEHIPNARFELFPISNIADLPGLLRREPDLKGLAVTIPYKEAVIPYLNGLNHRAKEIGAVNCIKISGGKLAGFNTDAIGFERSFSPLLKEQHKAALILGTGGASKAIQYVLRGLSIPYKIVTRQAIPGKQYLPYGDINEQLLQSHPVIINCSPVGMHPNASDKPMIPYEWLTPRNFLFDLIYSPEETEFLRLGKEKGATTMNGYEMLVIQAEENWKIWKEL